MNYGIDYGRGLTNIDHNSGIRFGVIPVHEVSQVWYDASEPIYIYNCYECGSEVNPDDEICPNCKAEIDFDFLEPVGFKYDKHGILAFQSVDSPDIFIEKSTHYTYACFCSPCAPGACYIPDVITDSRPENNKCYCFPKDWHEGKIKHRIYKL